MSKRINVNTLKEMKAKGQKITMLTAYDFPGAKVADSAGTDLILVGDSLGMVVLGHENTLSVTLDDMIHHGKAVVKGSDNSMVVIDMPFLTYQISREDAMRNAGRIIQETGGDAVKLEGGEEIIEAVSAITGAGIPVMGHLGLTPQAVGQMGGYKVQGKDPKVAKKMIADALFLEKAGVFAIVLECVPWQLAELITKKVSVPIIGIGAGKECDGQVLVYHDVLGLQSGLRPKFVKKYASLEEIMIDSVREYVKEVQQASFPGEEHIFTMDSSILEDLK